MRQVSTNDFGTRLSLYCKSISTTTGKGSVTFLEKIRPRTGISSVSSAALTLRKPGRSGNGSLMRARIPRTAWKHCAETIHHSICRKGDRLASQIRLSEWSRVVDHGLDADTCRQVNSAAES